MARENLYNRVVRVIREFKAQGKPLNTYAIADAAKVGQATAWRHLQAFKRARGFKALNPGPNFLKLFA